MSIKRKNFMIGDLVTAKVYSWMTPFGYPMSKELIQLENGDRGIVVGFEHKGEDIAYVYWLRHMKIGSFSTLLLHTISGIE